MTQNKQHPPLSATLPMPSMPSELPVLPEEIKAALHEILAYSWWEEARDWVDAVEESRPGSNEHIYPALKLVADWSGRTDYQHSPHWTLAMGTPSLVRLTKRPAWDQEE